MGPATLNHLMNTYKRAIGRTSLSSSFQLAGLPPTSAAAKQHLYRTDVPHRNGWEILCHQRNGSGDHRMKHSHQWKLTSLLLQTLCSTWYHADAKKVVVGACPVGARHLECFALQCAPNARVKPAALLHLYHWMMMKILHQHY